MNEKKGQGSVRTKASIIERFQSTHFSMDDQSANRFLKVAGLVLLSLLSLFVLVKTINEVKSYMTIGENPKIPATINVSGHGEVKAKRNMATLMVTSHGEGKTIEEAQSKAAESNNKALAYLKTKNIPEGDITTSSYNTYPKYDQKVKPCVVEKPSVTRDVSPEMSVGISAAGSAAPAMAPAPVQIAPVAPCNNYDQVIVGYETTQTLEIKIKGIDANPKLSGEIVTGLGQTGVQVSNLVTKIEDIEALQSQARAEAIIKARVEAQNIAKSLGVKLGELSSYYENNYGYPMAERMMGAADATSLKAAIAPEMPVGDGTITSDVNVTFEVK